MGCYCLPLVVLCMPLALDCSCRAVGYLLVAMIYGLLLSAFGCILIAIVVGLLLSGRWLPPGRRDLWVDIVGRCLSCVG